MRPIFGRIGGFRLWSYGFLALICIAFSIKMLYESEKNWYFDTAAKESQIRNNAYAENISPTPSIPSITMFVRMAGKLKEHRTRFYCDFYRTAVLFWPASFGRTVVVLDEESVEDHVHANNLTSQIKQQKKLLRRYTMVTI